MKTVKTFVLLALTLLSQITFAQCWKEIAAGDNHSVAIKADGTLWAWGRNHYGQLGDGTTVNKNVPTQIGTDTDWASIDAASITTVAIKTDGSLWAWGDNSHGQIGDGNHGPLVFNTIPTRIGTDTDWIKTVTSVYQTFAIKSNRTLWGWGQGEYLGNGDTIDHYTPFQIGTDLNWSEIVTSCCNRLALKEDNTLWGWGLNNNGALGTGAMTTPIPIPTQIGNGTNDWSKISAGFNGNVGTTSMLIKMDGSLWGMGSNQFGSVGVGSNSIMLIPTQVGSETVWSYTKTGGGTTFGIKTNGSLWGWGRNSSGQLGDGTLENKNVPVAIGTSATWKKIVINNAHVLALSSDNSLYTWGFNFFGQMGDGTLVNKNVPTLLGNPCSLSTNDFKIIKSFQAYPNPTTTATIVSYALQEKSIITFTLSNNLGQIVYQKNKTSNLGENQESIDLGSFSSGVYFITIQTTTEQKTIKVIKN